MLRTETISVIIPTYNSDGFISEAIESVLRQTIPPQEIIVVDDGSTDHTKAVVNNFGEEIQYVYQENSGVPTARNKGLEIADGDLIAFIDADDIWLPNKIELQLQILQESSENDMVIGFLQRVREGNDEKSIQVFEEDESGIFVLSLGSTLIRKEIFKQVGNFDEDLTLSEDLDWFLRAREFGVNTEVHDDVVQFYRQHKNNTTRNRDITNSYMMKAFKKSLDRRRETGNDISMRLPSFKNMDEIVEFWNTKKVKL